MPRSDYLWSVSGTFYSTGSVLGDISTVAFAKPSSPNLCPGNYKTPSNPSSHTNFFWGLQCNTDCNHKGTVQLAHQCRGQVLGLGGMTVEAFGDLQSTDSRV